MFGQNTFGNAPTSTPAFGASTGGFGAGGSLFNNQAKPGGLFGQQQTTSSSGGWYSYTSHPRIEEDLIKFFSSPQVSLELKQPQIPSDRRATTPLARLSGLEVSIFHPKIKI